MLRIGQVEATATQDGKYTDGSVAGGIAATRLRASAFNAMQEELAHIVESAGLALDINDMTQVLKAIQKLTLSRANPFADIKSDGAAAISTALTNLGLGEGSALPVGVPVPWPAATAPTGWLKCNGAAFTAAQYPKLAQAYPALVLPDLRAEFIRGWDDGRGIDSSRVLLSSQKGSVIPGDDGLSTPNVVGINNLLNNTALWGMDQATVAEITGCYIAVIASTNSSNSIQTNIAGISRPRNVAFNYIVRAA
ncbi:TPA: phage tail protein [Escherichia coli]|nr:tail fiber protein [Escherichia coli]EJV2263515.1 tail fiber protein [Escherichia coli]ELQ8825313.1 tail fiber protein [Escherichia coli]ELW2913722.1 tail fiber protein [Escherichia coli]